MNRFNYLSKMRKFTPRFVLILLFGICSSIAVIAQDEPTDVLIWQLGYSSSYDEILAEQFNEESPDINLIFEDVLTADGVSENNQKLRIAMENEAGPDIVGGIDVGANLEALVATGQVKDLTAFYEVSGLNERIPQSLIDLVTIDGAIYAIPQNMESAGLFYNKDIFEELGFEVPSTYDEYVAILEALKEAGYYGYAMGLAGGWPSALMASEFMYISAGSEYIDVLSGTEAWTDCSNCLAGLEALNDHVTNEYTNPDVLGIDYNQAIDLFYQGQTAMVYNGPWFIDAFLTAQPDFEVGFFYLPPINPDSDIVTIGGTGGAIIIAEYAPVEATLQVAEWLISEDVAVQALRDVGHLSSFPIDVPDDIDPLFYQIATETSANIESIGFWPVTYLAPQVFGDMNQIVQGMIGGQLTPDQLLEEMQDTHSTYLAETADG